MSDDSLPFDLGPYEIDYRLHRGLRIDVYVVDGPEGKVAIKVARNESARDSIKREHTLLRKCNHENIVRAHDSHPDGWWFAMDWIRGRPIHDWAREKTQQEVAEAGAQLADAIHHLHENEIIHGDLKPRNVLIDENDQVKLIDLGVAVLSGETRDEFKGTMGFAAPELLRSATPTPHTDVYGIGATLYAAVTGRAPFVAEDPAALAYMPLITLPAPPSSINPDVPAGVELVLLTLLQRDPRRRPGTVERIGAGLLKGAESAPAPPIVGMHDERELLRRAVIAAASGKRSVIALYGPSGSGRTTLIEEALEAARRAGLRRMKSKHPGKVARAVTTPGAPVAAWLDDSDEGAIEIASVIAEKAPAVLLIVRSTRPLPELGRNALQLAPTPLEAEDIALLLRHHGLDETLAVDIRDATGGLPAAVLTKVTGVSDESTIPPTAWSILAYLRENGETAVADLASANGMSELALLDHCEVLFASDLIAVGDDGRALSAR